MFPRMDISDLPDRLKRAGLNQASLSRFMGLDPSSLTKTIKGERQLKAHELAKIEEFFALDPSAQPNATVTSLAGRRRAPQSRIPVYGYATQASDIVSLNNSQVVDWIDAPPTWSGTGDLIAIRIPGDLMEPRLFAGEIVLAQLGLPPTRDRDCVIEFTDGTAVVRTYKGQKDGFVFGQQFNPDKRDQHSATKVKAIHAVIWRR